MTSILRKIWWPDVINLGLASLLPWFFYSLLSPLSQFNHGHAVLSAISIWAFLAWMMNFRRYGLERDLGLFGWILSTLGAFAAYGCYMGTMVFILVDLPKVDPARVAPFVQTSLACLVYTLVGLFTFWTRFKVGPNHIVIIGSHFYWPGDQLRLYPFRNFEGSILNRFIPVHIRDLELECTDGTFKVNADTVVEISVTADRLLASSSAQRVYTRDYLTEQSRQWVIASLKERAKCRTLGTTLKDLPAGGDRHMGLTLSWTQRPTVQLVQ